MKQCYRVVWSVEKIHKVKNPKAIKTKNVRIILLPDCTVWNSKKSRFVKEQEANGLSSSLGIITHISKISLIGPFLF